MIIERPEGNKLEGLYRGEVIQHLPHGKLKVFIPSVYDPLLKTQPDKLPVAEQLAPLFAGTNQGNGVFSYPNIGSIVMCQFINGDQNFPIVIGATLGGENSFGQYSQVFKSVMSGTTATSTDISVVNHSSPSHLITAGKTHIHLFEDGRLSAITTTPTTVPVSVDFDSATATPLVEKEDINIDSQFVIANAGEISASTNDYMNDIHSFWRTNISGNINLMTYSPEVSTYINMDSQGTMTIDTREKDSSAKIIVKSNGNVIVDSASSLQIHSDEINLCADTQIQMHSPYCSIKNSTSFIVESPNIQLQALSGTGIVTIRGKTEGALIKK